MGDHLEALILHGGLGLDQAKAARESFLEFERQILTDKKGNPLPFSEYNELLAAALLYCWEKQINLGHMAPPGISKSTTIRAFLCWLLGRDPTLATTIISAEGKLAQHQVGSCRKMILSKKYRSIFPEVRPDLHRGRYKNAASSGEDLQGWTKAEFYFRNAEQAPDPAMSADSADPTSEARRLNFCFADDVMSRNVARSMQKRTNLIDAVEKTWEGRLSEGGIMAITHNCWQTNDLLHKKLEDSRYLSMWVGVPHSCDCLFVRLKNAPPDFPLLKDPKRFNAKRRAVAAGWDHEFSIPLPSGRPSWTSEHLKALRDAKPAKFGQLHGLNALRPEDRMFPSWHIKKTGTHIGRGETVGELLGVETMGGLPKFGAMDLLRFAIGAGIDFSGGKEMGDCIAFFVKDHLHRKFPIEIYRGEFSIEQIVSILNGAWSRGIRFSLCYAERNGTQKKIAEGIRNMALMLQYEWAARVEPFLTGENKMDPESGLPAIDVEFKNGIIIWPSRESTIPSAHSEMWALTESEHAECARILERGETPDGVMGCWFANKALDRCSVSGDYVAASGTRSRTRMDAY